MRRLLLACALLLAACETPAPAPGAAPAPPRALAPAPNPTARPEDAPPATIATPPPVTAEPAPTTPPAERVATAALLPDRLAAEQVEKTFRLHQRYFSRLYRQRLPAHADLAGTVYMDFQVRPDGSVEGVRLAQSSMQDAVFEASVVKQVGEMNFPPAQQPTPVSRYPVVFKK